MASINPSVLSCPNETFTSKHGYVKLTITNITQTGGATNQTTVDYKITVEGTPWVALHSLYVSLGGVVLYENYSNNIKINWSAGDIIKQDSITFNNNEDGSLTLNAYIKQLFYYTYSSARWNDSYYYQENSVNMVCSTIPRYTSITSFTVAKRNETSLVFNWQTADTIDYLWYSTNNGSSWTGLDVTDGTSGNFTVSGLSPNTTYNCKIRVRRRDSQLTTDSNTVSQTTYKVPTQSLKSKTETSITMNWSCDTTANYIWYSKDGGTNWTAVGSVNATSGTYTISGLSANTSYNIKTRVRRSSTSTTYDTSASSQTTYNYPHITAVNTSELVIGNSQKLTLYNPLGRSVTIKMYKTNTSGTQLYSGTTSGTSITFTPTANTLYASIPNEQNANCVYTATYSSSTIATTGNYKYKIIGTEIPTFSNFTYIDSNSVVTGVTGNNQIMVKGLSTVQVTVSSANKMVANNSATAKSYSINMSTLNASVNYSSSDIVKELGTITASGTQRLSVVAYDSRNLSKTVYKDITVYDYAKPVVNATVKRLNDFENESTLKVSGTYTKLTINNTNKNSITNVKYRYRETGGTWSGWINLTTTVNNGNFTCSDVILSLDNTKSFEFQIQATDTLQQTTTSTVNVDIGQAIFFISTNNKKCYINSQEAIAIEKGTSNGTTYIKYSDGTLVQYGTIPKEDFLNENNNKATCQGIDWFRSQHAGVSNLPCNFIDTNYSLTCTPKNGIEGTRLTIPRINTKGVNYFQVQLISVENFTSSGKGYTNLSGVDWIAIGRWI